jgi:glutaredoxin 3
MSLTSYSEVYTPEYLSFIEIAIKHERVHWTEQDAKLGADVAQWNSGKITPEEKELVKNILRLFTQSDVVVGQAYYEKIMPVIKNNEARNMLGSFAARESIHQRAYALLSDTLGFGPGFYHAFMGYAEMKEKHEFMVEQIGKSYHDFAVYLAKQTMIEGVNLFASFAVLLNFDRLGKLPGMCDIVRWSMIDESIHVEGNCALFREFLDEHPSIVNDEFKKEIYETARTLVKLEDSFIDRAFKLGGVSNLDKEDVKKYVRYVTDYRLNQLGFKKNWHVKDNPLDWIDSMMGKTFSNFFEREVVEYSKNNLTGDFSEAYAAYGKELSGV